MGHHRPRIYQREYDRDKFQQVVGTDVHPVWLDIIEQQRPILPKAVRDNKELHYHIPDGDSTSPAWYTYQNIKMILDKFGKGKRFPLELGPYTEDQRERYMQQALTELGKVLYTSNGRGKGKGKGGQVDEGRGEGEAGERGEYEEGTYNDEEEEDDDDETVNYGGGGADRMRPPSPEDSLFRLVRNLLEDLAMEVDYSQKEDEGNTVWHALRVLRSQYDPRLLSIAKQDYHVQVDDIYIILDTSGSMNSYAGKIATIAASAVGLVHLFHGEEARPQQVIQRTSPLSSPHDPFPEWRGGNGGRTISSMNPEVYEATRKRWYDDGGNNVDFACEVQCWLDVVRPPVGSYILFWGDTMSMYLYDAHAFALMMRPYKVVWMTPYPLETAYRAFERYGPDGPSDLLTNASNYRQYEVMKLIRLGIPCLGDVVTPEGVREALQALRGMRKVA